MLHRKKKTAKMQVKNLAQMQMKNQMKQRQRETEQNADTDPVNEEFLQITEKRAFQEGESVLIEIVSANTAYNRLYIGNRSDEDKTPVIEGSMDEEGRYRLSVLY